LLNTFLILHTDLWTLFSNLPLFFLFSEAVFVQCLGWMNSDRGIFYHFHSANRGKSIGMERCVFWWGVCLIVAVKKGEAIGDEGPVFWRGVWPIASPLPDVVDG